jgi:soluble lytic murein transglycosylase-like protein
MPKRWDFRRLAVKGGIIALGTVVAAGTLHHTTYVNHTPLGARVAAADSAASARIASLAKPVNANVQLDNGINHARIDYWVSKLTTSMKDGFSVALGRKEKYEDMITSKLDAKGMPRDLIYLAMIESEFNPNAKSPVKAVGMWQFMSGTAKRFGLAVGKSVDERKDPARATDAAVDYLSSLHDRFGSWYLAAAAYNSGEGTVLKALKRVLGKTTGTDADFFKILPSLPKETQDYVPKLIAASRVGNAPAQYGVTPASPAVIEKATVAATKASVVKTKAVPKRSIRSHKTASARHVHKVVKPQSTHRRSSHR